MCSSLPITRSSARGDLWGSAWEALWCVWRKAQLLALGLLHLLFSSDQLTTTMASVRHGASSTARAKRIVFVRHAESEWNVVFNRGGWWAAVVVRLLRAVLREWLLLPTCDSLFIDSPLSRRGVRQCEALAEHVALACEEPAAAPPPAHWLRYLGGAVPNSIVVASNLRRAIDTARIVSATRLASSGERIHVLSSLQEIGRNIDTLTLSEAYALPALPTLPVGSGKRRDELFDVAESHGNKAVRGSARERLDAFANWAVAQPHEVVVVYGHSHWFRAFCRAFLPPHVDHPLKTEKLANCAVVAFELHQLPTVASPDDRHDGGGAAFVIAPNTFQYVR